MLKFKDKAHNEEKDIPTSKLELKRESWRKPKCSKLKDPRIKMEPSTLHTLFTKAGGQWATQTISNPKEKGVSRESCAQNFFLDIYRERERERENVKSDFKMLSCQLIYDIPARAENTTLERQEQKN